MLGRRGGCWRSRWCWRGPSAGRRPRPAGWTARRCGEAEQETVQWTVSPTNGCTATMPKASPGWRTGRCRSGPGGWHPTSWPRLRPGSRLVQIWRGTGWCAGGGVTCSTASRSSSASSCTRAASATQLAALGFRRLSVRPQHPKSDPEAQAAFKKNVPEAVAAALPARARDKPLEIWFQGEPRCRHRSEAHSERTGRPAGHAHPHLGQAVPSARQARWRQAASCPAPPRKR